MRCDRPWSLLSHPSASADSLQRRLVKPKGLVNALSSIQIIHARTHTHMHLSNFLLRKLTTSQTNQVSCTTLEIFAKPYIYGVLLNNAYFNHGQVNDNPKTNFEIVLSLSRIFDAWAQSFLKLHQFFEENLFFFSTWVWF